MLVVGEDLRDRVADVSAREVRATSAHPAGAEGPDEPLSAPQRDLDPGAGGHAADLVLQRRSVLRLRVFGIPLYVRQGRRPPAPRAGRLYAYGAVNAALRLVTPHFSSMSPVFLSAWISMVKVSTLSGRAPLTKGTSATPVPSLPTTFSAH